jgi:hypothetical protein
MHLKNHKKTINTNKNRKTNKNKKEKGGTRKYTKSREHKKTTKLNCNPVVAGKTANENTCYTKDTLMKIRDEYNKNHEGSKQIISNDPNVIWSKLKENLDTCNKEDCWLKELRDEEMKQDIQEYIFAPYSPPEWKENPNEWLSNIDILNVLKQYEEKHPNFEFLGPSPIDFDEKGQTQEKCIEQDVCTLSLKKQLENKKNKIAIVFNLDRHDQPGSHWVSLFIDLEYKFIFYFDSAGNPIPKEIEVLKDRLIKEANGMNMKIKYYDNKGNDHQKGSSECGMYSLFFIITLLDKKMSMKEKMVLFQKKQIPDKFVEEYRDIYFNHSS